MYQETVRLLLIVNTQLGNNHIQKKQDMNIKVYSFKAVAKDFCICFTADTQRLGVGFYVDICLATAHRSSILILVTSHFSRACWIISKENMTSLPQQQLDGHFVWRFSCQVFQCVLHLILSAQRCSLAISSCGFTHANSLQLFGIGACLLGRNSKRVSFTHISIFVFLFHVFPLHIFLSFFQPFFLLSSYFSFLLNPAPIILISSPFHKFSLSSSCFLSYPIPFYPVIQRWPLIFRFSNKINWSLKVFGCNILLLTLGGSNVISLPFKRRLAALAVKLD